MLTGSNLRVSMKHYVVHERAATKGPFTARGISCAVKDFIVGESGLVLANINDLFAFNGDVFRCVSSIKVDLPLVKKLLH